MEDFSHHTYQQYLNQHKFMASRCRACDALHLPPRPLCPACFSEVMDWEELSGEGRLAAFTTVHIGTSAMIAAGYGRTNPYCAGIVQLVEGPAISAQILGLDATRPDQISIGTPLQATFIERGEGEARQTYLAFTPLQISDFGFRSS